MKFDKKRLPLLFDAWKCELHPDLYDLKDSIPDKLLKGHLEVLSMGILPDHIDYVSKPIYDKIIKDRSLADAMGPHWAELQGTYALIILPHGSIITFICVAHEKGTGPDDTIISSCQYAGPYLIGMELIQKKEGNWFVREDDGFHAQGQKKIAPDAITNFVCTYLLFKKYVEIETKVIGGKDHPRKLKCAGEKHLTELSMPVNIIDSTYYIRTVRTNGFTVSGHWRWQRCGAGFKDKKLIWIQEFDKSGYTRRAKKETL